MLQTIKKFKSVFLILGLAGTLLSPKVSYAYPVFAQNAYQNPREATGRIVCANCHLAQKPTEVEVPQGVLPDTVFEAVVEIPYDTSVKQVTGDGSKGGLNVGAVVVLPEGFKLAPANQLPQEIKEKIVEGRIQKRLKEMVLIDQPFIRDSNITIEELVKQNIATLGENIQIRRFERFVLGEGLQKKEENFSDEVEKMLKK